MDRGGCLLAIIGSARALLTPHLPNLRVKMMMSDTAELPLRVMPGATEAPNANLWCAPSFSLDEIGPACERHDLAVDGAFVLSNVLSQSEAARMVLMAEQMGFERGAGDEAERRNGALSWCFHDALSEQLIRRVAPHLPWAIAVHRPGTAAPTVMLSAKSKPKPSSTIHVPHRLHHHPSPRSSAKAFTVDPTLPVVPCSHSMRCAPPTMQTVYRL